jgi:hypothetical protein
VANTVASLGIDVTARTAAFEKGLRKAQNDVKSFASSIGGIEGKLIGFATGGLGGIVAGVAGAVTSLAGLSKAMEAVGASVGIAAQAEQTQVVFATLLQSAERAKEMIRDLQSFAIESPFKSEELKDAAKRLLSFKFEGDRVLPLLRMLGDVSAGSGKDIAELATIFGQVKLATRLTGAELLQFTNANIAILPELAQMLGKTEPEIKKMVEAGSISFEMVTQALQRMTQEGGLFFGLMEAQSKTLGGRFSAFQESLERIAMVFGKITVESLNMKGNLENVSNVATDFTTALTNMAPKIEESLKPIGQSLSDIAQAATGATSNVAAMQAIMRDATTAAQQFAMPLHAVADAMQAYRAAREGVENWLVDSFSGSKPGEAARQRALMNAPRAGVKPKSEAAAGSAVAAQFSTAEFEWTEKMAKFADEAKKLDTQLANAASPLEKYQGGLDSVRALFEHGVIDLKKYTAAQAMLRAEFERTDPAIKEAKKAMEDEKKKRESLRREMESDAKAVRLANPIEKFRDELTKLTQLRMAGLLSGSEFARARKDLFDDTAGEMIKDRIKMDSPQSLARGSAAAASAIIKATKDSEELAETKKTRMVLEEIARELRVSPVIREAKL